MLDSNWKGNKSNDSTQQGFSLIQTLVAVALTGVILSVTLDIMRNTSTAQRSFSSSTDLTQTVMELNRIFMDNATCKTAFGNGTQQYNAQNLKILDPGDPNPNKPLLEGGAKKNGWQVESLKIVGTPPAGPFPKTWLADLELKSNKASDLMGGSSNRARHFRVYLTINAGNFITDCYSEQSPKAICENMLGNTYDTTKTPPCYKPTTVGPIQQKLFVYDAASANANGDYVNVLEASCPANHYAINCLACEGAGCTPAGYFIDHNPEMNSDLDQDGTVIPSIWNGQRVSTYITWSAGIVNPTGPGDATPAKCVLRKAINFSPHPYPWPNSSFYKYQTGGTFVRLAAFCQKF